MSRTDSHIHLFESGYSGARSIGAEVADYEVLREKYEISNALVVGYEGDERFTGNSNYILDLSQQRDWIVPLVFLDPAAPVTPEEASDLLDRGARGFSIYLDGNGTSIEAFDSALWTLLNNRRAVLSINASSASIASASGVICALEGAHVLMSHLGLPGELVSGVGLGERTQPLAAFADFPHVSMKLSALYAIDPRYPHLAAKDNVFEVLDQFGAARLLWGSDFAPGLDVLSAEELFRIPEWFLNSLSDDELSQVMHNNLQRIIRKG